VDGVSDAPESPVESDKQNGVMVEPIAIEQAVDKPQDPNGASPTDSTRNSKRLSHASLDNVDLGDGPLSEQPKGTLPLKSLS